MRRGQNLDLQRGLVSVFFFKNNIRREREKGRTCVNAPAPPARTVLAIQLSIAIPIYRSIFLFCSQSGRSASVNPGGRGSLPGAQMGTTKGRWEVIGLRVPEPRACEGLDMEEFILQVMK